MFFICYNVTKPEIPWNFRFLITPVLWLLSKTCELETQIESLCEASIATRCLKSFKQSKWHSVTKSFFEHRIRFQNRFVQSTKFFLLVIDETLHNHSYSTFLLLAWTYYWTTGRVIGDETTWCSFDIELSDLLLQLISSLYSWILPRLTRLKNVTQNYYQGGSGLRLTALLATGWR